jgi:hypothetical protein
MMLQAILLNVLNNILISMPTPDQLKQLSESLEGTLYTMIFIKRYMRQMLLHTG